MRRLQLCFGGRVQTISTVSLSLSSPDSTRESWKLVRQLPSETTTFLLGTDSIWLWFPLLVASTAPPSGGNASLRCLLRPPNQSQFSFPVQVVLLDHCSSPPGDGRKVVVGKLSHAGPVNSYAESNLQKTARDLSALEHITLVLQGMKANQMFLWVQTAFFLGEGRSICRPEGFSLGSTEGLWEYRRASWGKLLSRFLWQGKLTPCLCCVSPSSLALLLHLRRLSIMADYLQLDRLGAVFIQPVGDTFTESTDVCAQEEHLLLKTSWKLGIHCWQSSKPSGQ